ncbi:HAF repeat-containing protein [Micromonospora lupini]|uniref:Extracellular repeat protein, HAF family n=1 Tax=Micromonospora lupini str. Lupac 08 TaxID=1150864 RepID=I0L5V0_9ACTN|nr:HAF repeat-containing protein [Micromonospora lupini]CCH19197.1 Protein of unknown function (extracellular HAF repeat protein) [Micromonospora lupini str. Lupac 08]
MTSLVSPRTLLTAATTAIVAATALTPIPALASPPSYRVVDLGTLSGGAGAATAMNDRGDIVGWSTVASGARHAVRWRNGVLTDLGVLPGDTDSAAVDVNEFGDVAITSYGSDYLTRAVLWRDGRLIDLGTLGGENSEAIGVNDRGQVLGTSEPAGEMPHRFLWRNGVFTDLGLQYFYEFTADVNNRGDVVGGFNVPPQDYPCTCVGGLLRDGVFTQIGSAALGINNRGQVVGEANGHAFRWQNGRLTDLGTLGGSRSWATAINDRGVVVGRSSLSLPNEEWHPFLWRDGVLTDLTDRGVRVNDSIEDINSQGRLVGGREGRPLLFR